MQRELQQIGEQLSAAREELARLQRELAAIEAGCGHAAGELRRVREVLAREFGRVPELDAQLREELAGLAREWPAERLERELGRLARARERIGAVNLRAVQELAELEAELGGLEGEARELEEAMARLRRAMSRLEREARERLRCTFGEVDRQFRVLFRRLFGGGEARLELVGDADPLRCGLELLAMPPGKKLQHLGLLSGGEKSLAALALLFAFFLAYPSPLCVLDEVDAALDDANVARFVRVMEDVAAATGARMLVVTHHPHTMAAMNRLYGVTMVERGVSRVVAVTLAEAEPLRATA